MKQFVIAFGTNFIVLIFPLTANNSIQPFPAHNAQQNHSSFRFSPKKLNVIFFTCSSRRNVCSSFLSPTRLLDPLSRSLSLKSNIFVGGI